MILEGRDKCGFLYRKPELSMIAKLWVIYDRKNICLLYAVKRMSQLWLQKTRFTMFKERLSQLLCWSGW